MLLEELWRRLPQVRAGLARNRWQRLSSVFKASQDKKKWSIQANESRWLGLPNNLIARRVLNFIRAHVSRRGMFPNAELIANACDMPKHKVGLAFEYLRKRGFVRKFASAREVVGYVHRRGL